jgi:hypothetical protein
MIDIGGNSNLRIYISTNAFKIRTQVESPAPVPVGVGTLTLTGLGGDDLTINVYGTGECRPIGEEPTYPSVTGIFSGTLAVTSFWTYDGLYDDETGEWLGP